MIRYFNSLPFPCFSHSTSPLTTNVFDTSKFSPLVNKTLPTVEFDDSTNVNQAILAKVGHKMHNDENHPLGILKNRILHSFEDIYPGVFQSFSDLPPFVSTKSNFDDLMTPPDHISRSPNDTYYLNSSTVLRTHTSAHQVELMKAGNDAFLVFGDVFRRDTVDASHYPAFHQLEGVRLWPKGQLTQKEIENDLKNTVTHLMKSLFGNTELKTKWIDEYFPFTDPSWELEVEWKGDWLEILGSGCVHPGVLKNAESSDKEGWAFGFGLERLAMLLFDIPDIRLFWTLDSRFKDQFKNIPLDPKDPSALITKFQPYSKYPACTKDVSFWANSDVPIHENDFHEVVRMVAGDLAEKVTLEDTFVHPKTGRKSHMFRISYRSMDRNLTNEEIDRLQFKLRDLISDKFKVELR